MKNMPPSIYIHVHLYCITKGPVMAIYLTAVHEMYLALHKATKLVIIYITPSDWRTLLSANQIMCYPGFLQRDYIRAVFSPGLYIQIWQLKYITVKLRTWFTYLWGHVIHVHSIKEIYPGLGTCIWNPENYDEITMKKAFNQTTTAASSIHNLLWPQYMDKVKANQSKIFA